MGNSDATERLSSWVIGNTVIHPPVQYGGVEEWLAVIREKMPQWEGAFKMRERELYMGVKWRGLTKALVVKIFDRLDDLEAMQDDN